MFRNLINKIFNGDTEFSDTVIYQTNTFPVVNQTKEKLINDYIEGNFDKNYIGKYSLDLVVNMKEFKNYCRVLRKKNSLCKHTIKYSSTCIKNDTVLMNTLERNLDDCVKTEKNDLTLTANEYALFNSVHNLLMLSILNFKKSNCTYELELKSKKEELKFNKKAKNLYTKYYELYLIMKDFGVQIDKIKKFSVLCTESLYLDVRKDKFYNTKMKELSGLIQFIVEKFMK